MKNPPTLREHPLGTRFLLDTTPPVFLMKIESELPQPGKVLMVCLQTGKLFKYDGNLRAVSGESVRENTEPLDTSAFFGTEE